MSLLEGPEEDYSAWLVGIDEDFDLDDDDGQKWLSKLAKRALLHDLLSLLLYWTERKLFVVLSRRILNQVLGGP